MILKNIQISFSAKLNPVECPTEGRRPPPRLSFFHSSFIWSFPTFLIIVPFFVWPTLLVRYRWTCHGWSLDSFLIFPLSHSFSSCSSCEWSVHWMRMAVSGDVTKRSYSFFEKKESWEKGTKIGYFHPELRTPQILEHWFSSNRLVSTLTIFVGYFRRTHSQWIGSLINTFYGKKREGIGVRLRDGRGRRQITIWCKMKHKKLIWVNYLRSLQLLFFRTSFEPKEHFVSMKD